MSRSFDMQPLKTWIIIAASSTTTSYARSEGQRITIEKVAPKGGDTRDGKLQKVVLELALESDEAKEQELLSRLASGLQRAEDYASRRGRKMSDERIADKRVELILPHFLVGADGAEDWHPDACPCRFWPVVAQALREAEQRTRREALFTAARAVCMYCDKRVPHADARVSGPNIAGNYTHLARQGKGEWLCKASSIYSMLAYERASAKKEPLFATPHHISSIASVRRDERGNPETMVTVASKPEVEDCSSSVRSARAAVNSLSDV